ncbi:carboxyl-terminal processing protease CtpB [Merismopedia glauca]|uniref:carboxyl-terminal processing protease CtpB n=1 Tax=Merismopedia glauca TaxID=292586 RepID=UPI001FE819B7|nr:carboxyl-terminal processing protease CtpB [Merismopedia glauca]
MSLVTKLLCTGAIATTATSFCWLTLGNDLQAHATLKDNPKAVVDEVWQIINREYVDGTFNRSNWLQLRQELLSQEYTSNEQAYTAIRTALEKLGDPYTRFMEPEQFKSLTSQTTGELSGVGIRLAVDSATKTLTIVEPMANSPAEKAGIKPGDKLLAIDGKSTRGMSIEQASILIRGEVGTKISLKLSRAEKGDFELKLTRAQIELPSVRYTLNQEGNIKVGYIYLSEFNSHSPDQMRKAIQALKRQKAQAFVLDLRENPGGLLLSSIEIARMWLDTGSIVRTVDRKGENDEFKANRTALTQLPLAVLVNGDSASASEILAGALQDNKRATIIGTETFGKALVQSVHDLSDGSGLAVTVAHYYTPKGTDIGHKGVSPDIHINISKEQQFQLSARSNWFGSPQDPLYTKAIAVLQSDVTQGAPSRSPSPVSVR